MYKENLIKHYQESWNNKGELIMWDKGPTHKLNPDFEILEFAPSKSRNMWTYATVCMSPLEDNPMLELHVFSSKSDSSIVELLTAAANYHQNNARFGLNHTMNFGRPWQDNSLCTYGFISLPYLDGPDLEIYTSGAIESHCYWLIPITESEVLYKEKNGSEALEELFDNGLDYLNPSRLTLA